MNKTIKIVSISIAVVAAIIIGALVYVYSSLDSIVKAAVESIASDMTQTEVTLNEVEISPTTGEGALRGFRMTNPEGYQSDKAFQFDEISVKIDVTSLTEDVVRINEIRITAPNITYELGKDGSNIDTINKNAQGYSAGDGDDSAEESGGEGPEFIVEHLYLNDGEVNITGGPLGDKEVGTALPDIHLTDIGKNDNGASPAEIIQAALGAVTKKISGTVSNVDLSSVVEGLGEGAKTVTDTVGGAAEGAGEGVKGAAEGAGEALKGLLGD